VLLCLDWACNLRSPIVAFSDPSDSSLVSANQTLTLGLESGFSQKPSICPRIFAFKSIVCQLLTFIVEVVLLLRGASSISIVIAFSSFNKQLIWISELIFLIDYTHTVYALCGQTQRARHFLITMFLITTSLETTGNALVIRSLMQGTGCVPAEISKAGIAIFVLVLLIIFLRQKIYHNPNWTL